MDEMSQDVDRSYIDIESGGVHVDCAEYVLYEMRDSLRLLRTEEVPPPSSTHPQSNAGVHSPKEVVSRKTVGMRKDRNGRGCGPWKSEEQRCRSIEDVDNEHGLGNHENRTMIRRYLKTVTSLEVSSA
ncbi:hypothetical protein BPOR_0715g00040 [Botrytis porri]|uniref:Uncharacterized protein n=2 Tax=Botrytis porri TaxID=87229 RepID=A0A4Z1KCC7_9HELO|nr:hypothetical protein BPOR_0715g00040 [Botrytis porri]